MVSEAFLRFFVEAVSHFGEYFTVQQDGKKVFMVSLNSIFIPHPKLFKFYLHKLQTILLTEKHHCNDGELTDSKHSSHVQSSLAPSRKLFNKEQILCWFLIHNIVKKIHKSSLLVYSVFLLTVFPIHSIERGLLSISQLSEPPAVSALVCWDTDVRSFHFRL